MIELIYGFAAAIFIIIVGYFAFWFRQRKLKARFENILKSEIKGSSLTTNQRKREKSEIPLHIEKSILRSLEYFEKNNDFTNSRLTLIDLAKTMNTNPNYLSKTINSTKGKNFSTYLNDIRLEFAL